MKIPKSLKLPRKLKKEVKKGFTRNVMPHYPVFNPVCRENGISLNMYETVSYTGSNTKSFRRLCKYTRKDEKRVYQKMAKDTIASMNFNFDNDVEDMLMGRMVFPVKPQKYIIGFDPANGNDYSIAGTHIY